MNHANVAEVLPVFHRQLQEQSSIDCLFSTLKYDKLIYKNTMKKEVEKEEKSIIDEMDPWWISYDMG